MSKTEPNNQESWISEWGMAGKKWENQQKFSDLFSGVNKIPGIISGCSSLPPAFQGCPDRPQDKFVFINRYLKKI